MLTAKQEAFCREYLIDLNSTQAAIRSGFEWPVATGGFYVYFLMDNGTIFYVGKGKGNRIKDHKRQCNKENTGNQVKAERIRAAITAGTFEEKVFAAGLSEPDAFSIEKGLIHEFRSHGITNIASGIVHPLESQIARINANLAGLRPFDEWDRIAPDYARRFAMKQHGSMRAFYDWFVSRFIKLRDEYEAQLRKENSYG